MKAKRNRELGVLIMVVTLIGAFTLLSHTPTLTAEENPDDEGNCLSFPVIQALKGASPSKEIDFRGTAGFEQLEGEFRTENEKGDKFPDKVYLQQDANNEWQAHHIEIESEAVSVDWIDWGDNLEARPWKTNSIVRVEVVLLQEDVSMFGYEMLWIEGQGPDEMWGTNTVTYDSDQATVYASDAYITVQFLGSAEPSEMTWDSDEKKWAWAQTSDPTMDESFTAEVNVKGKVIHGCSWWVRDEDLDDKDLPVYYRITMSFDNASVDLSGAQILMSTETEAIPTAEESGEPLGGVAVVDTFNNLTYIDVLIVDATGQGGGGGKGEGGFGGDGG